MKYFCFRRLGCCLAKYFDSIDLGVVLKEKIIVPMDLVVILWKILFHRLGCRPMESYASVDLVVVLREILVS